MSASGKTTSRVALAKLLRDYGMLIVLLVLCLLFSILTINEQHPTGAAAAKQIVAEITKTTDRGSGVLIVGRDDDEDGLFSKELKSELANLTYTNVRVIAGDPSLIRTTLEG
jgi:ribose transport system permease protein